jgi:hypothetical protein
MVRPGSIGVAQARRWRAPAVLAAALVVVACQSSATPSPTASGPGSSVAGPVASPTAGSSPSQTVASPSIVSSPQWVAAGSTTAWRHDPKAIRLSGDRVLLVGSVEPDEAGAIQTTAEVWDPSTNAWTATEGLPKARQEFVAVAFGDNLVLVAGGLNADEPPQSYSSAYVYDGEKWTKTGLMGAARTGPGAAALTDGRVLIAGGYFFSRPSGSIDDEPMAALAAYWDGGGSGGTATEPGLSDVDMGTAGAALATAELFDPGTGTWSATGPLRYARYNPSTVALADGRVLVVGSSSFTSSGSGVKVDGHAFNTAEIYDPAAGRFTLAGTLPPVDRAALKKQATKGANPMPDDDGELSGVGSLVALRDGGAVLIGQTHSWKHVGDMTRSFRFDGSSNTWTEIGQTYVFIGEPTRVPLWTPGVPALGGARVAALLDGRVLVAGGQGPNQFGDSGFNAVVSTKAAQLYDPATNTWSKLPPMAEPRSGGATVVLSDGSVMLADGVTETTEEMNQVTSATRFVP